MFPPRFPLMVACALAAAARPTSAVPQCAFSGEQITHLTTPNHVTLDADCHMSASLTVNGSLYILENAMGASAGSGGGGRRLTTCEGFGSEDGLICAATCDHQANTWTCGDVSTHRCDACASSCSETRWRNFCEGKCGSPPYTWNETSQSCQPNPPPANPAPANPAPANPPPANPPPANPAPAPPNQTSPASSGETAGQNPATTSPASGGTAAALNADVEANITHINGLEFCSNPADTSHNYDTGSTGCQDTIDTGQPATDKQHAYKDDDTKIWCRSEEQFGSHFRKQLHSGMTMDAITMNTSVAAWTLDGQGRTITRDPALSDTDSPFPFFRVAYLSKLVLKRVTLEGARQVSVCRCASAGGCQPQDRTPERCTGAFIYATSNYRPIFSNTQAEDSQKWDFFLLPDLSTYNYFTHVGASGGADSYMLGHVQWTEVVAEEVTFRDGQSAWGGGAIQAEGVRLDIRDSVFDSNTAGHDAGFNAGRGADGGAIHCAAEEVTGNTHPCYALLTNVTFVGNHAAIKGGAVYLDSSHVVVTDGHTQFANNSAADDAAGHTLWAMGGVSHFGQCAPGTFYPGYSDPILNHDFQGCPLFCETGFYQAGFTASPSCHMAPAGTFVPNASVAPINCPPGKYGTRAGLASMDCSCKDCPRVSCCRSVSVSFAPALTRQKPPILRLSQNVRRVSA